MGRIFTGISIGGLEGMTIVTAEVAGSRISLVDSWNDPGDIQLNDQSAVGERITSALSRAGVKRGPVSITLPDTLARVSVFDFDELPRKRAESDELIAARAAKAFGIDLSEYRLDSQTFNAGAGKKSIVAAVKSGLIESLDVVLSAAGIKRAGIGIHSFSLANLLPDGDEDGTLVVRYREFVTVIVFRAGVPDFYRCKGIGNDGNEAAERDVAASLAFYTGRNPGAGLGKIYLFDETSSIGNHIADIVKTEIVPVGREFFGSGGVLPGVLPALGSCIAYA